MGLSTRDIDGLSTKDLLGLSTEDVDKAVYQRHYWAVYWGCCEGWLVFLFQN